MKSAVVGIGAALAASACCIGPVVFTLLGAGALSAASLTLIPYRPWFIGVTALIIGMGFYGAYRPVRTECAPDGSCTPQSRRTARVVMWIAARVLLVATVLALLTPAPSRAADQQQPTKSANQPATQTCTLKVSGMTCASCDVAVRLAAKSVSGVKTVNVDYPKAKAEVTYDPSKTNPQAIADAITKASGFKTEPVKPAQK